MPHHETRDPAFSARNRTINAEDEITLTSVGIDIGSSTSHLAFSRIVMQRRGSRYAVESRTLLFESAMFMTPFVEATSIDALALEAYIDTQYREAGFSPDDIDAGALILTGVAARRANARAIGDALSRHAGRLVALSAGDRLETTLVAHGSGAVQLSRDRGFTVMAVDVGGGTSKIAVCTGGMIVDRTVIDVGARLICFDEADRVTTVEPGGRRLADELHLDLGPGTRLTTSMKGKLAARLAQRLFEAMAAIAPAEGLERWLRIPPLGESTPPALVLFCGGVSEYLHGRESRTFGDLGAELAEEIATRARVWGVATEEPAQGIRATVLGAAQYTLQVSGSTIFVEPQTTLPLRNVVSLRPTLALDRDTIDCDTVARAIRRSVDSLDTGIDDVPLALCVAWRGAATYDRLDSFCRGLIAGLAPILDRGLPLVIVTDSDVGGLLGMHCRHECRLQNPVVSIDGIVLSELDYVDVGALLESSGAVPVVIKSLVFAGGSEP